MAEEWHGVNLRRWRQAFSVALVVGVLWLVVAAGLGVYQGYRQRVTHKRERAALHYQRGVEYLSDGRLDMARKELEFALILQPDHAAASAALRRLQESAVPTRTPTPTPSPEPTRPPAAEPEDLGALFDEAMAAYQAHDWEKVIQALETIRQSDAGYQREEVERLLFESYRGRGQALVEEDRLEEALRMFDRALALRPDAQDVRDARELATLYIDGLSYWWADWDQVIKRFEELYKRSPDYRDVRQRLAQAYAYSAERLGNQGDWCAAAERYGKSLAVMDSAEVRKSQDQAEERCRSGVGVITEAGMTEKETGRIALAAYDPFVRRYRVFMITADQDKPQPILEEAAQPAWSPDGQSLAFRSLKSDELGIEVFTPSSGKRRRVTRFVEDGFPAWSPDGQQIVFASNREGDRRWRIYRTWADGASPATSLGFGRAPAWSPDGQRIVYQGCDERGNRCGLWSMMPDGGDRRPLTDVPDDTAPAWSPDGSRIAFMSYERTKHWGIYLLDVATGKVSPLVVGENSAGLPVWSPDGRQIAFMSNHLGAWAIYVIPADGGTARKVADLPGTTDDWLSERLSWGP